MTAILEAIREGSLAAEAKLVFSNNPEAPALETASKLGIKTASLSHKGMTREQHEQSIINLLAPHQVDYIVLAGYMRVLTPAFLRHYRDERGFFRIINIHPSLLPAFPGANAYEDAFHYGVRLSGITVHLVDEQVDHGPILAQESFPRFADDTLQTFKERGLAVEHKLYPRVLQDIAEHGITSLRSVVEPATVAAAACGSASRENLK